MKVWAHSSYKNNNMLVYITIKKEKKTHFSIFHFIWIAVFALYMDAFSCFYFIYSCYLPGDTKYVLYYKCLLLLFSLILSMLKRGCSHQAAWAKSRGDWQRGFSRPHINDFQMSVLRYVSNQTQKVKAKLASVIVLNNQACHNIKHIVIHS